MKRNIDCPTQITASLLTGKWKPWVLMELKAKRSLRFNELEKTIPKITSRILSLQLKELEEYKLIKRKVINPTPLQVEYSLDKLGELVMPVLEKMLDFGTIYINYKLNGEIVEDISEIDLEQLKNDWEKYII